MKYYRSEKMDLASALITLDTLRKLFHNVKYLNEKDVSICLGKTIKEKGRRWSNMQGVSFRKCLFGGYQILILKNPKQVKE